MKAAQARRGYGALRLRLVSGTSPLPELYFVPGTPKRVLTVGSARECSWLVQAENVQRVHVELRWDGDALWVRDPNRAGDVAIDGDRVSTWRRVLPGKRLVFGLAMMVVDDVDPEEDHGVPTLVVTGSAESTLPGERTMVTTDPDMPGEPTIADVAVPADLEDTTLVRSPEDGSPRFDDATDALLDAVPENEVTSPRAKAAPEGGDLRPRLGMARADALPSAAATKLVAAPADDDARTTDPPNAPASWLAQSPTDALLERPSAPRSGFDRDTDPTDVGQPAAPNDVQAPAPAPAKSSPLRALRELKTTLPVRTWAMLIVTVLAGVVVFLMDSSPEEEPTVQRADEPAQPTAAEPRSEPVPAGTKAAASDAVPAEPREVAPPEQQGPAADDEVDDTEGETRDAELVAEAADLLIARRYREALPRYEALASAHPDVAEYALIVRILRAQLGEETP